MRSSAGAPDVHIHRKGNLLIDFVQSYGDADAAVEAAPHRLTVNLKQHRGGAHPIETRGLVASFDAASDLLTVWSSTQLAHEARFFIMKLLGLDENRIRVVTPDVGGGFGAKFILYPEEVAISAASLLLRRPVKWIEDRREHFLSSIQERDQYWDVEVGFDDDGPSARRARHHDQRRGRVHLSGHQSRLQRVDQFSRPLRSAALQAARVGGRDQQGADRAGARRGLSGRLLRDGTRARRHRARSWSRPRRRCGVATWCRRSAMPYATPMQARSTSAIVYESGDFPACLDLALTERRLRGLCRRAAKKRAAEGLLARLRHRHRSQGHRPRPVRIGDRPRRPLRQGVDLHRRDGDGAGAEDDARADRRRSGRRAAGRHHGRERRHVHHPARSRRLRQPPDRDRRQFGAPRGAGGARKSHRDRGADARRAEA